MSKHSLKSKITLGARGLTLINGSPRFVTFGALRGSRVLVYVPGQLGWHSVPIADVLSIKSISMSQCTLTDLSGVPNV